MTRILLVAFASLSRMGAATLATAPDSAAFDGILKRYLESNRLER